MSMNEVAVISINLFLTLFAVFLFHIAYCYGNPFYLLGYFFLLRQSLTRWNRDEINDQW